MKHFVRILALVFSFTLLIGFNVAAAEKNSKSESSAFIELQLQNISEQMGISAAQQMFTQTLDVLTTTDAVGMTAAQPAVMDEEAKVVEFSLSSAIFFVALALLFLLMLFGLLYFKKNNKTKKASASTSINNSHAKSNSKTHNTRVSLE